MLCIFVNSSTEAYFFKVMICFMYCWVQLTILKSIHVLFPIISIRIEMQEDILFSNNFLHGFILPVLKSQTGYTDTFLLDSVVIFLMYWGVSSAEPVSSGL